MSETVSSHSADYDSGFGQGSIVACNAILGYLDRHGHAEIARQILLAWDGGHIAEIVLPAGPAPMLPAILLPPPAMSRENARGAGYTGDACTNCQSTQVKRNGSCLVCEACGQTTGCS